MGPTQRALKIKSSGAWSWPLTSTSEVKNAWSYTSTSPIRLVAWYLVKHKGNFIPFWVFCFICLCPFWGYERRENYFDTMSRFLFGSILMEEDNSFDMSPFSLWTHPIKLKCCECSVEDGVSTEGFFPKNIRDDDVLHQQRELDSVYRRSPRRRLDMTEEALHCHHGGERSKPYSTIWHSKYPVAGKWCGTVTLIRSFYCH
jgi:hypothetical protein